MPPLDLTDQGRQLLSLGDDFDALHTRVRDVSYTLGTDALQRISPLLLKAQELTAAVLVRLSTLDSSAYTRLAGSRSSLECLASVAVASTLAGNDLASALFANPYDGAPFDGYPAEDASTGTTRHSQALPKMARHLADAAHQLDLSATGCRYVATGITHDLGAARDTAGTVQEAAVPALTGIQYDALKSLAPRHRDAVRGGAARAGRDPCGDRGRHPYLDRHLSGPEQTRARRPGHDHPAVARAEDHRHQAGTPGSGQAAPCNHRCPPCSGLRNASRGARRTPVTHFAPQDRVLVSPRYLAGAGIDRLADAIGPLSPLPVPFRPACPETVSRWHPTLAD
ncbi:hypothetical protein ABT278_14605 [Streptomyces sp. NPDC001228]|uniref:hypothetical protein n=1 Tax=Streptomyces sp. NPDC001228 TaxID=3154381 RepID=UPI003316E3EF